MSLLDPGKIRKVAWWEYAERFVLGAPISAVAAIGGHTLGDKVAGALLAFPAVLPASLTLAMKKDGRAAAVEHERGAVFGGGGKLAFALVIALTGKPLGGWAIAAGIVAWVVVGLGSFLIVHGRRNAATASLETTRTAGPHEQTIA